MTPNTTFFMSKILFSYPPLTHTANDSLLETSHKGTISTLDITIDDTCFVPNLSFNLLSVSQLCNLDLSLKFLKYGCLIQDLQTDK